MEMKLEVVLVRIGVLDHHRRRIVAADPGSYEDLQLGVAPDNADYGSFASFSDPDGNGWLPQEIKERAPGR